MADRKPFVGPIDYELLRQQVEQQQGVFQPPAIIAPAPVPVVEPAPTPTSILAPTILPEVADAFPYTLPPEEPEQGAISRFVEQAGVGFVETAGTATKAIEWAQNTLIGDDEVINEWAQRSGVIQEFNDKIDEWVTERTPEDMALSDQIARGLGGIPLFFIPAMGVGKVAEIAKVAPKIANWYRIGTMAVLDSASAAGGIYSDELKKTGDADRASEVASKVFLANLPVSVALDKFGIFGDVRGTGMKGVAERAARSAGAGAVGGGIMAPTIAHIRDMDITGKEIAESAIVGGVVAATMGVGVQLLSGYKGKARDFSDDSPEVDQLIDDAHAENAQKATDAQAQPIISPDSLVELSNLNRKLAREEVGKATDTPDFKLKTEEELIADLIETGESNDRVNDIILDKILAYYDYKQSKVVERAARKDTKQMFLTGDADLLTSDLSPAELSAGAIDSILVRQDAMDAAGLMADERVRKSPEGRDNLKKQLQMDEVAPDVAEMILYSYDIRMKKQETPITTTTEDVLLIEDTRKNAIEITNKSVEDFNQSLPKDQKAITAVVDEVSTRYNNSPLANKLAVLKKSIDADSDVVKTVQDALDESSVGKKLKSIKKQQKTVETELKKIGKRFPIKEKPIVIDEKETLLETASRLKKEKKTDNVMKLRERRTDIMKERQALADKIYQSEIDLKDTGPEHLSMLDKMDALDSELSQISFKLNERVSTELKDITQIIPDFLKIARDVTADPTIVTEKLTQVGKAIYKSGMTFKEFIKDMRFALGEVFDRFKNAMTDIYEMSKRILASERGSTKLVKATNIEPNTTPDDASMIIKEADEVNTRLEDGDIRKNATPAIRLDGTIIKEGTSYKEIGNYQAEAGLQELGYVTDSGVFIPASDFAGGAVVPNETIKVTGQPKTNVQDAVEKMRSPAIERAGEGKVINSTDGALTIGDLKVTIKKMKKQATKKKISFEDYLRDLGLSERAVGEFVAIDAMHVRGANVIKKMTGSQVEAFEKFEINEGISIERVMKDLDIPKPAEGKKLTYKEAGKIMTYIQNELGVKTGDIIELEVVLQSIQDGTRYTDNRNEGIKAAHFVRDLLLSPKQVLSRTAVGTKLYRIFDRSQVFKEKDLEYMYGKTGLNLDKSLHLLKPGSDSNKRIAEVLDGQKKADGYLNAEEVEAVGHIRSAFDYMADRFVKLKTRNAEEERLVRQLADTVKVKKGEKIGDIKKKLSKFRKEFNISKGGMESIDMLRMKIDDYLPHLFDRGDLIKTAAGRLQEVMAADPGSPQIQTLQDMISRLEGGEFIMHTEIPRDLYFAHLEKRRGIEGYQLDAGLALEAYTKSWTKKVYVEPAVNAAKDLFIKLPAEQKTYAKWFIMEQAGKNKRHPGAAIISQMEWIRTLGFSLGSALGNATGIVNTITEGGLKPHAWEGFKRAASKEGIEEFYATGLARSIPQITAIDEVPHILEKVRTVTGIFFNTVERGLRNHAYHTGKAQGKAMGLTGDDLVWHSIDFVNKTQHRYGVIGMAKGMRGWGGVVTQFSSYPIKQAELINSWMRGPDGKVNARGVQKVLAYMAMSAGINVTMKELLATDVSNFLGVGISYGELMETAMALSEADWLEAEKHWKLTTQGGHGILPSSIVPFGPFMGLIGELHDMRSPQYLSRIGGELTPVMADKFVNFYFALRDGDAKTNKFPVYAYEAKDMIGKITGGPKDLKYTLGLKETIIKAFGPRPAAETAAQAREYARFVTDDQIKKIVKQFDKALHKGDSKAVERLFRLYPGIVFDRGTGGARRVEEKLTRTREERDASRLKRQRQRASLGFEL